MSRVLVLGNATLDVIQRVARLPRPGETLLADSTTRCAGGKGLNQAVAASRTGAATRLAAPVGRDADAAFVAAALRDEAGLEAHWLPCDAPTDMSAIWVATGGENVIVSSAACARAITSDQARDLCRALMPGDVLLMQGNLSADSTEAAAREAQARGALRILNTAPIASDMGNLLALFDIVIANEGEAELLTQGSSSLAAAFRTRGIATAIVTLGERGALIISGGSETVVDAPKVVAVDSAGAGDVFVGTLAGLVVNGMTITTAVKVAVAAASHSVTRLNTTPSFPSRAEIALLRQAASDV
ncbi:ribokinase [Nitrobacteraceae bacterium AZCC 2161]|jgi:ribokinase